jgi:frataxin-like iron-binding protein CyaY
MIVKKIILGSELTSTIIGGKEFTNDNMEVWVESNTGEKFVGTFFTYENIEWLRQKNNKTGECLSGKYFWSSDMLLIERLDRNIIEEVIEHLIKEDEFDLIFDKIEPYKAVWVFNGENTQLSGGIFEKYEDANSWIKHNKLTGILTKYPLNKGVFDWAEENDLINMKKEKIELKRNDPWFIGGFTTASMEHFHYKNGLEDIQ